MVFDFLNGCTPEVRYGTPAFQIVGIAFTGQLRLAGALLNEVIVEDRGHAHAIGLPYNYGFTNMIGCARSSAGDDRDRNRRCNRARQFQIKPLACALSIDGHDGDLTSAQLGRLSCPLDRVAPCRLAAVIGHRLVAAIPLFDRFDRNHYGG